jgi:hypothetical protein
MSWAMPSTTCSTKADNVVGRTLLLGARRGVLEGQALASAWLLLGWL